MTLSNSTLMIRSINFAASVDANAEQTLPRVIRHKRGDIDDFISRCDDLCFKLLRLFALGLEVNRSPVDLVLITLTSSRLPQKMGEKTGLSPDMIEPKGLGAQCFDGFM